MEDPIRRTATLAWHEATSVLPHLAALDGLAYVRAVAAGELPPDPLMELLGIRVVSASSGSVEMAATPESQHMNLGGIVHGGFLSVLLDSASGYALHTTLPVGATGPHVQVAYAFERFALEGRELRCTATVSRAGRSVAHVRAEVTDPDGRVVASGTTANVVLRPEPEGTFRSGPSA